MNDKNIRHSIHIELIKAAALFAREARSSAGDNQKVFAKKVGISNQTLSRIETAFVRKPPSLETLSKIARAANKDIKLILGCYGACLVTIIY